MQKLRAQLDRRREKKQEIIELQLKLAVNEADGLGFFGEGAGFGQPPLDPRGMGGMMEGGGRMGGRGRGYGGGYEGGRGGYGESGGYGGEPSGRSVSEDVNDLNRAAGAEESVTEPATSQQPATPSADSNVPGQ